MPDQIRREEGRHLFRLDPEGYDATRRLLEYGADPLLLVEPDERFATILEAPIQNVACEVMHDATRAGVGEVAYRESKWTHVINTDQVGKLYGNVERNVTSCLYLMTG